MTSQREPQITTKDVVLNLDRKVDELIAGMADLKVIAGTVGTTVETLHDHETRLRSLERFRYTVPSAAVFVALAAIGELVYYLSR